LNLGYISIPQPTLINENDLKSIGGGVCFFGLLLNFFGIKYGIINVLKISNPLNTKYLVGCVAPPLGA